MLERRDSYDALYRDFRWTIPARFNIGAAVSDRWAAEDPDRVALFDYRVDGAPDRLTFGELSARSNALANGLRRSASDAATGSRCSCRNVSRRVIAHVAIYKLGAIAVPLALLFGVEALEYRLQTAGVKAVVTTAAGHAKLAKISGRLPALEHILVIDGAPAGAAEFGNSLPTTRRISPCRDDRPG